MGIAIRAENSLSSGSVAVKMYSDKCLGIRVVVVIQLLGWATGANILALMGMTSHSHHIWQVVGAAMEHGRETNGRFSIAGIAYCCMSWLSGVTI